MELKPPQSLILQFLSDYLSHEKLLFHGGRIHSPAKELIDMMKRFLLGEMLPLEQTAFAKNFGALLDKATKVSTGTAKRIDYQIPDLPLLIKADFLDPNFSRAFKLRDTRGLQLALVRAVTDYDFLKEAWRFTAPTEDGDSHLQDFFQNIMLPAAQGVEEKLQTLRTDHRARFDELANLMRKSPHTSEDVKLLLYQMEAMLSPKAGRADGVLTFPGRS